MAQTARRWTCRCYWASTACHFGPEGEHCFNSAAYVARDGRLLGRYDKMHLVMFGEYVPFAEYFPWLQRLTPLPISVTAGERPAAFELGSVRIAPNICYESVLSHVIRRQVNALTAEGKEPDILVNLTNDGWFWGSSELDMHLACGVFRAVECRKPFLIAANTGFSAWIDGDGRIRSKARDGPSVIIAEPRLDRTAAVGIWPTATGLPACVWRCAGCADWWGFAGGYAGNRRTDAAGTPITLCWTATPPADRKVLHRPQYPMFPVLRILWLT